MPIKNVGTTSARLSPSTRSVGALKALVASAVGASDRPDEVQAQSAIDLALDWLLELDWDWFLTSTTFATVASTASYALPADLGDIYNVRVSTASGTERPMLFIQRDLYDRVRYEQTSTGLPTHYTTTGLGEAREITLVPTPDSVETLTVRYFREPAHESDEADTLDIARYMEHPLVLYAQALAMQWRGKVGAERAFVIADSARRAAHARDSQGYDESVRMVAFDEHGGGGRYPWTHPQYRED